MKCFVNLKRVLHTYTIRITITTQNRVYNLRCECTHNPENMLTDIRWLENEDLDEIPEKLLYRIEDIITENINNIATKKHLEIEVN